MYISVREVTLDEEQQLTVDSSAAEAHSGLPGLPGFRWAMLLRSLDEPSRFAVAIMWLNPDAADASPSDGLPDGDQPARGYDVTTARGDMTPATYAAIVDWELTGVDPARFTARWNAAYHAIEDRLGSRLGRDLGAAERYAGLHVATDAARLDPRVLDAELTDAEGLAVRPTAVQRYRIVRLTEA